MALGAAGLGALAFPPTASAGQAVAISLKELARRSRRVTVATRLHGEGRWEVVGSQRRIVTYSRVRVDELIDGESSESELVVRTLGGRVGKIGQIVHGEAQLVKGHPNLLFLHELREGVHAVTAMAQGQFLLRADSRGARRLHPSPYRGRLIDAPHSAARLLLGRNLPEAARLIREARRSAR